MSQQQLYAFAAQILRTSSDLKDCGLDDNIVAQVAQHFYH
jgi:hypothetical protein